MARGLFSITSLSAAFVAAAALGYPVTINDKNDMYPVMAGSANRLRPPGALKKLDDEQKFLAACIKCGQCVQVCPVNAIKLSDIDEGVGIGEDGEQ